MQEQLNQEKNHSTHVEDMVLHGPKAVEFVFNIFDDLFSNTNYFTKSLKIDGAPVVLAGSHFLNIKKPFVAAKSFLTNGKCATNDQEIEELFGDRPGLAEKMRSLLHLLPKLDIPKHELWRGDFLFSQKTLKEVFFEGTPRQTFHPNTLIYSASGTREETDVSQAQVGIVWHTVYKGPSLDDLTPCFNIKTARLKPCKEVFTLNPIIPFVFHPELEDGCELGKDLTLAYDQFWYLFNGHMKETYEEIINNKALIDHFITYQNHLIKTGHANKPVDIEKFVHEWIPQKYSDRIAGLKTQKAQDRVALERDRLVSWAWDARLVLERMADLIDTFARIKSVFIRYLNRAPLPLETFYRTHGDAQYHRTHHEGFVISDKIGNSVKFIDRAEFSRVNFGQDTVRGWKEESLALTN